MLYRDDSLAAPVRSHEHISIKSKIRTIMIFFLELSPVPNEVQAGRPGNVRGSTEAETLGGQPPFGWTKQV